MVFGIWHCHRIRIEYFKSLFESSCWRYITMKLEIFLLSRCLCEPVALFITLCMMNQVMLLKRIILQAVVCTSSVPKLLSTFVLHCCVLLEFLAAFYANHNNAKICGHQFWTEVVSHTSSDPRISLAFMRCCKLFLFPLIFYLRSGRLFYFVRQLNQASFDKMINFFFNRRINSSCHQSNKMNMFASFWHKLVLDMWNVFAWLSVDLFRFHTNIPFEYNYWLRR